MSDLARGTMTLRRLVVLVKALPRDDSYFWQQVEAAREKALKPTVDQIRAAGEKYAYLQKPAMT